MIHENSSFLHPFILSWNLRNVLPNPSILTPDKFSITGTCLGEYPINGWKPYFLEIPKDGHKQDLSGRFNSAMGTGKKDLEWDPKRTVILPEYSHAQNYDIEQLKTVIKHWDDIGIPEDIPCIAIAVKCDGFHSDFREAQLVTVLVVWNDAVARLISLDWFEGPLEDCITPEWYVKTTSLLNLKSAFFKIEKIYNNISWDNISYSIYTIPMCLGLVLNGKMTKSTYGLWGDEWKFTDFTELNSNLSLLLSEIQEIFSDTYVR